MTSIREFQDLMERTYLQRDQKRGIHVAMLWTASELGEMIDAVVKEKPVLAEEEAADVFAWLCSICNLLGIDLEDAATRKYGKGCPKCRKEPCNCSGM